ncbi:MAG: glycosyltransferase family 39 protein [Planctomycetota bacterium]
MADASEGRLKEYARFLSMGVLALLFSELVLLAVWPIPLLDPDEPLFACVAREMIRSGDYVTPAFKGEPFYDRPALFYWLLVGSVFTLGDGDLAYRVPSLLLGMGTICCTSFIARDLFRREADSRPLSCQLDSTLVGAASAFVMATSIGGNVLLLGIGHDAALVFFVSAAIWSGLRWQNGVKSDGGKTWAYASLTGVLCGLACLSKGLLGFLLPGLAICSVQWGMGKSLRLRELFVAIPIALIVGGSWYVMMHAKHPDYVRYYLWERHVLGFLTRSQRHGDKPFWQYLPALFAAACPWVLLVPARFGRSIPNGSWDRRILGLILWFLATFLFFAVAGSRNPTYLLPTMVPLVILFGAILSSWLTRVATGDDGKYGATWISRVRRLATRIPLFTLTAFLLAMPLVLLHFHRPISQVAFVAVASGTTLLAGLLLVGRLPQPEMFSLGSQCFVTLLLVAAAAVFVIPEIAKERSAESLVDRLRKIQTDGPILWFNHIPPSALYYGRELEFRRVYFDDIQIQPTVPTLLVTRESRLEEVSNTPFVAGAQHWDSGGKYHVFFCGPSHPRLANSER